MTVIRPTANNYRSEPYISDNNLRSQNGYASVKNNTNHNIQNPQEYSYTHERYQSNRQNHSNNQPTNNNGNKIFRKTIKSKYGYSPIRVEGNRFPSKTTVNDLHKKNDNFVIQNVHISYPSHTYNRPLKYKNITEPNFKFPGKHDFAQDKDYSSPHVVPSPTPKFVNAEIQELQNELDLMKSDRDYHNNEHIKLRSDLLSVVDREFEFDTIQLEKDFFEKQMGLLQEKLLVYRAHIDQLINLAKRPVARTRSKTNIKPKEIKWNEIYYQEKITLLEKKIEDLEKLDTSLEKNHDCVNIESEMTVDKPSSQKEGVSFGLVEKNSRLQNEIELLRRNLSTFRKENDVIRKQNKELRRENPDKDSKSRFEEECKYLTSENETLNTKIQIIMDEMHKLRVERDELDKAISISGSGGGIPIDFGPVEPMFRISKNPGTSDSPKRIYAAENEDYETSKIKDQVAHHLVKATSGVEFEYHKVVLELDEVKKELIEKNKEICQLKTEVKILRNKIEENLDEDDFHIDNRAQKISRELMWQIEELKERNVELTEKMGILGSELEEYKDISNPKEIIGLVKQNEDSINQVFNLKDVLEKRENTILKLEQEDIEQQLQIGNDSKAIKKLIENNEYLQKELMKMQKMVKKMTILNSSLTVGV